MRSRLGRSLIVLAIAVVAIALSVGWYAFGAWPVPNGYSFPRHSQFGGPDALYVGTLENVGGCIRAAGDDSFAVVWPPGYWLSIDAGEPVVHGGFREVRMGEPVRMGGGYARMDCRLTEAGISATASRPSSTQTDSATEGSSIPSSIQRRL